MKNVVKLDEMQVRFTYLKEELVNAIFILRQMLEKYDMAGKKLYIVFVDLMKGLDRVPKIVIWWSPRKDVIKKNVLAIKKIYKRKKSVKIDGERSKEFK